MGGGRIEGEKRSMMNEVGEFKEKIKTATCGCLQRRQEGKKKKKRD